MIPSALLNQTVTVMRRTSTGVDSLNNPIYGTPTSGTGWNAVYTNIPVRMAFSAKQTAFTPMGERILPNGIMYFNPGPNILAEDRVVFVDSNNNTIEYNVISVVSGVNMGSVVDHFEAILQLP